MSHIKVLVYLLLSIVFFQSFNSARGVDPVVPEGPGSQTSGSESFHDSKETSLAKDDGAMNENYQLDYQNPYELNKRSGLSNFFSKIHSGGEIAVAYLGGSITMQPNGWADRTQHWLETHYPSCKFRMIKAALNGTGADLAACRLEQDALAYHPDLLFVEFVVNGGTGSEPGGMVRALEGVVRQTWRKNPTTDICFVYTVDAPQLKYYPVGAQPTFSETARAHEKVADFYAIPSVVLGCQISDMLHSGQLVFQGREVGKTLSEKIIFSHDGTHPTNAGSQIYAGALVRSLLAMETLATPPLPHGLERTLDSLNWEEATAVGVEELHEKLALDGMWNWISRDEKSASYGSGFDYEGSNLATLKALFPQLLGTSSPGSKITFRFEGTKLGFFDVGGPFAGRLLVSVDQEKPQEVNRFTIYSSHLRHQYFFLPRLTEGIHEIHLVLEADPPNKSTMADFQQNQAMYQKNEFYLGKILMIGKILSLK